MSDSVPPKSDGSERKVIQGMTIDYRDTDLRITLIGLRYVVVVGKK